MAFELQRKGTKGGLNSNQVRVSTNTLTIGSGTIANKFNKLNCNILFDRVNLKVGLQPTKENSGYSVKTNERENVIITSVLQCSQIPKGIYELTENKDMVVFSITNFQYISKSFFFSVFIANNKSYTIVKNILFKF